LEGKKKAENFLDGKDVGPHLESLRYSYLKSLGLEEKALKGCAIEASSREAKGRSTGGDGLRKNGWEDSMVDFPGSLQERSINIKWLGAISKK
jgi:hypothetical protein